METLGISKETLDSMKRFFLKHAIPKLMEKRREEERVKVENDAHREALHVDGNTTDCILHSR